MNTDKNRPFVFICVYLCASVVSLFVSGCTGKPNQANIALRKQVQQLESEISELKLQHTADAASIRSLEQRVGTVPTLPRDRLDQLYTAHGIRFGRLTGGVDLDPSKPGDEALKVYVVPIDQTGDAIKSTGSFTIEAYDLSLADENRLGRWEFSVEEAARDWIGELLMYSYSLTCPWQRPPHKEQITLRVTFRDALTGREFSEQRVVRAIPPASPPATAVSGQ